MLQPILAVVYIDTTFFPNIFFLILLNNSLKNTQMSKEDVRQSQLQA